MAEIRDNAVITVDDLNNIAVDLGDTTFSAFSGEKFGVDKLNEITADLVGKGILNIGNKCMPVLDGGVVYIQTGVIVFESGAKIRITLPVMVAAAIGDYIYAFNDVTTGRASIQTSAGYPTSGDYVMLAQRNAGASVTDLRQYSVAKTTLSADVENNIVEQEVVNTVSGGGYTYEFSVTPSLPSCQIIVLLSVNNVHDLSTYSYNGVVLSEEFQTIYINKAYSDTYINVKKSDGKLVFRVGPYFTVNSLKFVLA